jgi:plasmid maintenance system antidote protein VapI
MDDYFLTNCTKDRALFMLKVAAELGIKMHTEPAYDIDDNLLTEHIAIHLDEGLGNMTEFWAKVAERRQQ